MRAAALGGGAASAAAGELANLLRLADALLASALTRAESRGAHARQRVPRDGSVVAPPARPRPRPRREVGATRE